MVKCVHTPEKEPISRWLSLLVVCESFLRLQWAVHTRKDINEQQALDIIEEVLVHRIYDARSEEQKRQDQNNG